MIWVAKIFLIAVEVSTMDVDLHLNDCQPYDTGLCRHGFDSCLSYLPIIEIEFSLLLIYDFYAMKFHLYFILEKQILFIIPTNLSYVQLFLIIGESESCLYVGNEISITLKNRDSINFQLGFYELGNEKLLPLLSS